MRVHDWQRTFTTTMPIARGLWPLMDTMWARQTESPWRKGGGIVVRVAPATGLAIGLWGPARDVDEYEALLEGLAGPQRWGGGGGSEVAAGGLQIWGDEYRPWITQIRLRRARPPTPQGVALVVMLWVALLTLLPA